MTTPQTPTPTQTPRTYPFECENCGHKPTAQSVIVHHGDCEKCRDTVITYSVDSAQCIEQLEREVDALKEQLRQKDDALKAANELRVSGGDTVKGGIVRAFVEFPAGTPIRVVSTLGDCIKAMDDLRESLRITGTGTGEPVFTPGTANYTH